MKKLLFLLPATLFAVLLIMLMNTKPPKKMIDAVNPSIERFQEHFSKTKYAILIDYSPPVFRKRLWVVDLKTKETVLNSHVNHSWKSGFLYARKFSNISGSKLSCKGVFITRGLYKSNHGKGEFQIGMNIDGLEKGINDKAFERRIVFHTGRQPFWSEGCFMTLPKVNQKITGLTNDGSILIVSS